MNKLFVPNIAANGILWVVGLAVQIGGWFNKYVAISLLGIASLWTLGTIIYWIRTRKRKQNGVTNKKKDNKFTTLIKAIAEAQHITSKGQDITVYITNDNGLAKMYAEELRSILLKLQDEKVLILKAFPNWLLPTDRFTGEKHNKRMLAILEPSRNNFTISLLKKFKRYSKQ